MAFTFVLLAFTFVPPLTPLWSLGFPKCSDRLTRLSQKGYSSGANVGPGPNGEILLGLAAAKGETNMSSATYRLLGGARAPRLALGEWPKDITLDKAILWVLKIACSLNFLFHGAWGVVGKEAWIPFFGFAGIGEETGAILQQLVGVMDITLGLIVLFAPTRWAILWMIVWAVWTASLRPLTGSAWWYF